MTAIVAVLNKHAVAVAADSAVTMGGTHKVINSGNKIFMLSKYHPIAVMTYNNAAFMGVPWDIIIKEYRKNLGKKELESVRAYQADFIEYLYSQKFFVSESVRKKILLLDICDFINGWKENIVGQGCNVNDESFVQKYKALIDKIGRDADRVGRCNTFLNYSFESFKEYSEDSFGMAMNMVEPVLSGRLSEILPDIIQSYFKLMISKLFFGTFTGLVFTGYGKNELYPALVSVKVGMVVDNMFKYDIVEADSVSITDEGIGAAISPFAQVDVVQTVVRGIRPDFMEIINKVVQDSYKAYSDRISTLLTKETGGRLKNLNMEAVTQNTIGFIQKRMQEMYTDPLLNTIVALDKEDMANIAESLVSLTSLVRRISPTEETVGGPVDVAVISKGDGFVWINRKHYFKPELNNHFFNNYFREE